jgi:hypothetical protein
MQRLVTSIFSSTTPTVTLIMAKSFHSFTCFLKPFYVGRVFVQTRDVYGNFLTSDSETIVFESCSSLGPGCDEDDETCTCVPLPAAAVTIVDVKGIALIQLDHSGSEAAG